MASSTSAVLGTYELLEHILLELPLRDLFVVQSVSSAWKNIINRSEAIKKRMFLLPGGPAIQPVKRSGFDRQYHSDLLLNPALQTLCPCDTVHVAPDKDSAPIGFWEPELVNGSMSNSPNFVIYIQALGDGPARTAMSMLLTQPPITEIRHDMFCGKRHVEDATLHVQEGLTFADLKETAIAEAKGHAARCVRCRGKTEHSIGHSWSFFHKPKTAMPVEDKEREDQDDESEQKQRLSASRVCPYKKLTGAE